jgi:uncharacterized membrane protein
MEAAVQETSIFSVFYFVIIVVIGTFIVLNLFLAILIDTFVENASSDGTLDNGADVPGSGKLLMKHLF